MYTMQKWLSLVAFIGEEVFPEPCGVFDAQASMTKLHLFGSTSVECSIGDDHFLLGGQAHAVEGYASDY